MSGKFKLKTKSSVKKRFKMTASGKILMAKSGKRHGMIKRSRKFIRQARLKTTAGRTTVKFLQNFIPYGI